MNGKTIVTIGREFGSGGRVIGEKLAEKLGVRCYDKELLTLAAKESGMCKELFETHDEKPTNSFLYSLVMDTYSLGYTTSSFVDMPINHKVFLAQFDTIKNLASRESCVIVGRCADVILRHRPHTIRLFIHAPEGFLPVLRENVRDGPAFALLDVVVHIDEFHVRFLCQAAAHSGFSAAHKPA